MKLSDIIKIFERHIPRSLQEKWDHCGLNLGSSEQDINTVMFSYDVCKEVVEEAQRKKCQLIVSHHPFRMSSTVNLDLESYEGQLISSCIKHGIALYSSHTNHDASSHSLNLYYLKKLGLTAIKPLVCAPTKLFKLIVFVPQTHTQKLMNTLFAAGAGHIGNYSDCSFRSGGTGSFKGNEWTNPTIGKKLLREETPEDRLEVIVKEENLNHSITQLKQAHPYEEVAFDIYPLHNKIEFVGMGAWGKTDHAMSKKNCITRLKKIFKTKNMRFVSSRKNKFQTIAICTGSGASLIDTAIDKKVDLLITGDVKYHQAIHAKRHDLAIADVGHFHSEKESVLILQKLFAGLFKNSLKYETYNKLKDAFESV